MHSSFLAAPASSYYVPIKSDASNGSLSTNEADFIRSTLLLSSSTASTKRRQQTRTSHSSSVLRIDGRKRHELRPCQLQLSRTAVMGGSTSATATVQWGSGTRILSTVEGELVPPLGDKPNEGMIQLSVDVSCGSSSHFRHAAPVVAATTGGTGGSETRSSSSYGMMMENDQKRLSNRILRCLERLVISSGALDAEALCVVPGEWVWKLRISLTVLDAAGGNLMDASVLACWASLRHYRRPHVQLNNNNTTGGIPTLIPLDYKEPDPLPLHHTPLSVSFGLVVLAGAANADAAASSRDGSSASQQQQQPSSRRLPNGVAALVDPTHREELVASGYLTLAGNVHGEILLMDYAGGPASASASATGGQGSLSNHSGAGAGGESNASSLLLASRQCCELRLDQIRDCHRVASTLLPQLCRQLDDSLDKADKQWRHDRLRRLQQQQVQQQQTPSGQGIAGAQEGGIDDNDVDDDDDMAGVRVRQHDGMDVVAVEEDDVRGGAASTSTSEALRAAELQAEEAYRRQALDYNAGHLAIKIKEQEKEKEESSVATTTSAAGLLSFLLESAKAATTTTTTTDAVGGPAPEELPTPGDSGTLKHGAPAAAEAPVHALPQQLEEPTADADRGVDSYAMSDDEEGEVPGSPTKVTSEFARDCLPATTAMPSAAVTSGQPRGAATGPADLGVDGEDNDDDVDDLAAAIKVKSKKVKKSKKK